jgi:hypothetical protein
MKNNATGAKTRKNSVANCELRDAGCNYIFLARGRKPTCIRSTSKRHYIVRRIVTSDTATIFGTCDSMVCTQSALRQQFPWFPCFGILLAERRQKMAEQSVRADRCRRVGEVIGRIFGLCTERV